MVNRNHAFKIRIVKLSDVKQAEIIEAFKSTARYLDDLLNIDYPYFEGMVNKADGNIEQALVKFSASASPMLGTTEMQQ